MPISCMNDIYNYKSWRDCNLDIFISLKNQYVYLMVCKSASSTVTFHLRHAEQIGTSFPVKNVNDVSTSPHILPFQLRNECLISILNSDSYKKITFVRNPYSRLLSCYLHRIIGEKRMNPSKRVLYSQSNFSAVSPPSFSDFVEFVSDQETKDMERHWKVQSHVTLHPLINLDFVGRQESLQQDMLNLENKLFDREMFDREKILSTNLAPQETGANKKLHKYYNDDIMNKVFMRYKEDFDNFGYSDDLPS